MTDVAQLLSEFIDAWNAGQRPRVDDYLARAPSEEQEALADALADWLAFAPTPAYDEAARRAIRAEPALRAALAAAEAQASLWPELLPRLRERAGLSARALAARLTAAFGLGGQEDRAESYVQRMEQGQLDPARVSRRLLDALGAALGVSGAELRSAGGLSPRAGAPAHALFRAERDAATSFEDELDALSRAASTPAPAPMDELDRLFCGGPDA
jgi:transcriptional regulator with XRE-family HTH domain